MCVRKLTLVSVVVAQCVTNFLNLFLFLGLDTSKEHEYVLLEEVVSPSSNINNNSPLMPTPNQRMVGMQEMPLQVRQHTVESG